MDSKMTPTPWELDELPGEIHIVTEREVFAIASLVCDPMDEETKENARAIVSAVNNTYGKGIDPEAVPDLYTALKDCITRIEYDNNHQSDYCKRVLRDAYAALNKSVIK